MRLQSLDEIESYLVFTGPSATAKALFLHPLTKPQNSYFIDWTSGMIDYIFEDKPKYLLLDGKTM